MAGYGQRPETNWPILGLVDNYRLLGVSANCTRDELRRAYYRKQLEFHTDKGGDLRICQQLNEAYRTLSSDEERKTYDEKRAEAGEGFEMDKARFNSLIGGEKCSDAFRKLFDLFKAGAAGLELRDGFYELYTQVMERCALIPLADVGPSATAIECPICAKSFTSDAEHSIVALRPYMNFFTLEEEDEPDLIKFLAQHLGDEFNEPPVTISSDGQGVTFLGAVSSEQWNELIQVASLVGNALSAGTAATEFKAVLESTKADILSDQVRTWILWAHDHNEQKSAEFIVQEIIEAIDGEGTGDTKTLPDSVLGILAYMESAPEVWSQFKYGAADQDKEEEAKPDSNWDQLAFAMLEIGYPATAIIFAKVHQIFKPDQEDIWFQLGMKCFTQCGDFDQAFACFIHGCCDLEQIANSLIRDGHHRPGIALLIRVKKFDLLARYGTEFKNKKQEHISHLYLSAYVRCCLWKGLVDDLVKCLHQHCPEKLFILAMKRVWLDYPEQFIRNNTIHNVMLRRLVTRSTGSDFRQLVGVLHFLQARAAGPTSAEAHAILEKAAERAINGILYSVLKTVHVLPSLSEVLLFPGTHSVARRIWNEKTMGGTLDLGSLPKPYAAALHIIRGTIEPGTNVRRMDDFSEACNKGATAGAEAAAIAFQNTRLHRASLDHVNDQLTRLKAVFEQRQSLKWQDFPDILTETKPEHVCQFRDNLASIESLKIVRLGELSLTRYSGVDIQGLTETAYSFLDLAAAGLDLVSCIGAMLMSMSYFVCALETGMARDSTNFETGQLVAYHKILHCIGLQIREKAQKYTTPFVLSYVQRLLFSLLLRTNQLVSLAIQKQTSSQGDGEGQEAGPPPLNLHDLCLASFYGRLLEEATILRKLVPVQTSRMHSSLDMTFLNFIGVQHLGKFLTEKAKSGAAGDRGDADFPQYIYDYFHFEGIWNEWLDKNQDGSRPLTFESVREQTMTSILGANEWTMDDVGQLMQWSTLRRTADGWHDTQNRSLSFPGEAYAQFYGLEVNERTGEAQFLVARPSASTSEAGTSHSHALFDKADILEIFSRRLCYASFTLEEPGNQTAARHIPMRSHPFQEAGFHPRAQLCGSAYLSTLLHTDLLLKELTTGTEVSAHPPFAFRSTKSGLLAGLPTHIRKLLESPAERKQLEKLEPKETANRFWIEVTEVVYNISNTKDGVQRFEIGDVKCGVFTKELQRDPQTSQLVDKKAKEQPTDKKPTPESQFAKDLTDNYDELGKYFPVLLRIKELMRISVCCGLIDAVYEHKLKELETSDLRAKMRDVLTGIKAQVPVFPLCSGTAIEEALQRCLTAKGVAAHQVAPAELTRVRGEISSQLLEAEQKWAQSVQGSLCEGFDLGAQEVDLNSHLHPFLNGVPAAFETLAGVMEFGMKRKYRRICGSLKQQLGMPVGDERPVQCKKCMISTPNSLSRCCNWIPATFVSAKVTDSQREAYLENVRKMRSEGQSHNDETGNEKKEKDEEDVTTPKYLENYRIYGGVRMIPIIVHGDMGARVESVEKVLCMNNYADVVVKGSDGRKHTERVYVNEYTFAVYVTVPRPEDPVTSDNHFRIRFNDELVGRTLTWQNNSAHARVLARESGIDFSPSSMGRGYYNNWQGEPLLQLPSFMNLIRYMTNPYLLMPGISGVVFGIPLGESREGKIHRPPDLSHPELKVLFDKRVVKATIVSRPLAPLEIGQDTDLFQLNINYGPLLEKLAQIKPIKSTLQTFGVAPPYHPAILVETHDGCRWLIEKGNEYGGKGGNTIIRDATHFTPGGYEGWRSERDFKVVTGRVTVSEYIAAGGKDYSITHDESCHGAVIATEELELKEAEKAAGIE